jgi:sugar lactone lactonase YvrE
MDIELELIASGYGLVEGPRTDADGALWFTDMFGDTVNRRAPGGQAEAVISERHYVGGLVPHADGGLVLSGPNIVHWRDGDIRVLYEGDGSGFFNDLHTDAQGRVYVGVVRGEIKNVREHPALGQAYRIELDGRVTELYGEVGISNGIGFSPNGQTLYHVDSSVAGIWAHDVDADGRLSNRRRIGTEAFPEGIPDGLCVDVEGNLWVAHYGGGRVVKLDAAGTLIDELLVPARQVTSCAFGGAGWDELYIVSGDNTDDTDLGGCVWHARPGITGVPTPLARV